ncbi:MAG: c-type cytochrome [Gammaproteobacteria bacterium]
MKDRTHGYFVAALIGLWLSATASAADAERGKALHEAQCTACHAAMTGGDGTVLYTRDDRRAISMEKLNREVRYHVTSLELDWGEEDIVAMVEYLNGSYYRLEP